MRRNLIIACADIVGSVAFTKLRGRLTPEFDLSALEFSEIEAEDELT